MGLRKKKKQQQMPVIMDDMIGIGSSTDFNKALDTMFSDEDVERKSELTARQINKLNLVKQMAEEYGLELLDELYNRFISLRISLDRKGRAEGVQMTQQIATMKRVEAMDRLFSSGAKK